MPPLRPPFKRQEYIPQKPKSFEELVFDEVKNELSPEEIRAFDLLVKKRLSQKPAMKDFDYKDIEEDEKRLAQKKKEAGQNNSRVEKINYIRVKIFEALLSELMELHWFPEVFITETSDFDDWINGVDAVFEGQSRAAIVDFTSAKDKSVLRKKINIIFEKIDRGGLGRVKYFQSQTESGKRMHLDNLPALIFGIDTKTLLELARLRLENKKKELENHWARHAIAEEFIAQIKVFKSYINNPNRRNYNPAKAREMSRAYEDIEEEIMKFKQKISQGQDKELGDKIRVKLREKDLVYKGLMESLA